ncbi:hypothetical protein GB937_009321 [Aspergillus fischeri]|nr:hypothetical protein GB937_009321 [Aspergillus fischeri]
MLLLRPNMMLSCLTNGFDKGFVIMYLENALAGPAARWLDDKGVLYPFTRIDLASPSLHRVRYLSQDTWYASLEEVGDEALLRTQINLNEALPKEGKFVAVRELTSRADHYDVDPKAKSAIPAPHGCCDVNLFCHRCHALQRNGIWNDQGKDSL